MSIRDGCDQQKKIRLVLMPLRVWLGTSITVAVLCLGASLASAASAIGDGTFPSTPAESGKPQGLETGVAQIREPAAVVADSAGFLYFDRVDVETIGADGTRRMRVASHGLTRPPAGKLLAPLEVLTLSSRYGPRISPLTGAAGDFHWGQDFSSPCGTRVYSADSGVARAVGWHPWGGGNRVEIDHGNGIITTYNHLESAAVEQGESVKVGEVIAHVGTTGSSTGCHLHFETLVKGIHTDPSNWELLPVSQLDQLDDLPRTRFDPGLGTKVDRAPVWAVPANRADNRVISGGDLEAPAPAPAPGPKPGPGPGEPGPAPGPCVPAGPGSVLPCEPGPAPGPCVPAGPGSVLPCEPGPAPGPCVPAGPGSVLPCEPGPAPGPCVPAGPGSVLPCEPGPAPGPCVPAGPGSVLPCEPGPAPGPCVSADPGPILPCVPVPVDPVPVPVPVDPVPVPVPVDPVPVPVPVDPVPVPVPVDPVPVPVPVDPVPVPVPVDPVPVPVPAEPVPVDPGAIPAEPV
ncbi:peptidase M23-like protein [Arthrobacter sp. SLBN-112]|nr:peptidase M23-like protein [Arthrobacter sp. SLBN-112]